MWNWTFRWKAGFSDHSIQLYYVDHVEPGNPKKAAFILRTDETIGMLTEVSHTRYSLVIQRVASFQKGTVNIEIESSSSTSTDLDANCCDSSTCTKNTALGKSPKESKKTTTRKSRSKLHQTHPKLKDFLEQAMWDWQTMAKAWNACFVAKIQNWIIVRGQTVDI